MEKKNVEKIRDLPKNIRLETVLTEVLTNLKTLITTEILKEKGIDDIEKIPPEKLPEIDAEYRELAKEIALELKRHMVIEKIEMKEKWLELELINVINKIREIEIKIQICGAPAEIIRLFVELRKYAVQNEPEKMFNLINDKILPEIRKNITGFGAVALPLSEEEIKAKHWYEFWK